jgi:hypothetical protein
MEGERGILQDRVEPLPVERCGIEPRKRIRRQDDEEQERRRDRALHGEHIGLELSRQIGAVGRDRRPEQREDQHPQHHGAFMVPPHAGDLVDHRLGRVGVAPDILDREVGRYIGHGQRGEGDGGEEELELRGGDGDGGKLRIAGAHADERQHGLHDGDAKGEDQSVMAGLGDHAAGLPRPEPQ